MTNAPVLCSGKQQKTEPGPGRLVMVSAPDGSLPSLIRRPQLTIRVRAFKHSNKCSLKVKNTQIPTPFQGFVLKPLAVFCNIANVKLCIL